MIRLSEEAEPEIYETTRRFGTILENVMLVFVKNFEQFAADVSAEIKAAGPVSV